LNIQEAMSSDDKQNADERNIARKIETIYREESRRVLATLIRLLGDFDLAEEALSEAFAAAMQQWQKEGIPHNPRAWLVSTGRFKTIDQLRRRSRFDNALTKIAEALDIQAHEDLIEDDEDIADDRLRLIFTCCHPSLSPDAQIALTLREVCGLTTEEIARAYLSTPGTVAQRIVRAKAKIRDANIPYEVPSQDQLAERLDAVLQVIYLVFNEGYSSSTGDSAMRHDVSAEAIRLGRLLVELLPEPEALGLLALMLLHDARKETRTNADGDLVLLSEQDRSLWNREQIEEGSQLIRRALRMRGFAFYTVQAAIAAIHAEASTAEATDWNEIIGLYDLLLGINPSPVIELNRAVAISMRDGAEAGLALIDALLAQGELADYHLAHSARADFCRQLGKNAEARAAYEKALSLTQQEPERRFLEMRIAELSV
jgi:RNA polymerase sigma-70 factor (ECF subfamily)